MIIEIKDLPEGQKIKRICVDVTFEDGHVEVTNSTNSTSSISSPEPESPVFPSQTDAKVEPVQESLKDENASIEKPVIPDARPKKDVPPEMLDAQF